MTSLLLVVGLGHPAGGDAASSLGLTPGVAAAGDTVVLGEDTSVFPELICGGIDDPGALSAEWELVEHAPPAPAEPELINPVGVAGAVVASGTVVVTPGEPWSTPVTIPADAIDGDVFFGRAACLEDGEVLASYPLSRTLVVRVGTTTEPAPPPTTDPPTEADASPAPAPPAEPIPAPATLTG